MRWWDGTRWTEHASGPSRAEQWRSHILNLVGQERSSARSARIALVVYAITTLATAALFVPLLSMFGEVFREIIANPDAQAPAFPFNPALIFVPQLMAPFQYGALIFFLIWVYRAAGTAHQLGIPARRSPGWAVGAWFIPVVNLWWPCQSLRDMLPHDDTTRDRITLIWIALVVGGVLTATGLILALFTGLVAWIVAFAGTAQQITAMLLGRRAVSDILAAHERLAAQRTAAP